MNRYEFHLRISADQYLDYYRGTVRHVIARCATGQSVQFPASLLRVAPVRLCDGLAARRLGSATTKRSGDSNEIEPVILVGY
jgi:hypothetical protein